MAWRFDPSRVFQTDLNKAIHQSHTKGCTGFFYMYTQHTGPTALHPIRRMKQSNGSVSCFPHSIVMITNTRARVRCAYPVPWHSTKFLEICEQNYLQRCLLSAHALQACNFSSDQLISSSCNICLPFKIEIYCTKSFKFCNFLFFWWSYSCMPDSGVLSSKMLKVM